jgi:fluoroacetyl-CoA thioesterase
VAELALGQTGEARITVDETNVASSFGSGLIAVFATPAMVALMENAASRAVQPTLGEGQITVGTRVDVRHLAATPAGLEVRAQAELIEIDGRRLVFRVEAFDPAEKIGEGIHERAIVDAARLLSRARGKTA